MEDTTATNLDTCPISEKSDGVCPLGLDEEEDEETDEISQWLTRTGQFVNNIQSSSASIANIYLEQGKMFSQANGDCIELHHIPSGCYYKRQMIVKLCLC